ncbi:MAG: hypothetical protein ACD_65C00275G0001 [uncultured bacterium]|nr:MAG: hypothetical protein ACD_65C00275G0001 [uncultured bacterium]
MSVKYPPETSSCSGSNPEFARSILKKAALVTSSFG